MKQSVLWVIGIALALSFEAHAKPEPLEQCKSMRARIERYDSLRRHGGTPAQMEQWRNSRVSEEEKFRTARCKKYGKAVRKTN